MTLNDWRANRLVDIAAKDMAMSMATHKSVIKELVTASETVEHALGRLAHVTWAANNYADTRILPNGKEAQLLLRDSNAPFRRAGQKETENKKGSNEAIKSE